MNTLDPRIEFDQPLQADTALVKDALSRRTFVDNAVSALKKVSPQNGLVVSIEGSWGSGKTSTLAMIENLLLQEEEAKRAVVVHFNPWLVGDRDALLKHFLARMAGALKVTNHAQNGKNVAEKIEAYGKALDVLKLIPALEPWASLIKAVVGSVGETTKSIAEYKTPDLEQQKQSVESALREFSKPIIVFIDDIDRLFPAEIYEMIRIVKAVGDLPHVGYVLAWDPTYVSTALAGLNVPHAEAYLDKIVQLRRPLPRLSESAKRDLLTNAIKDLPEDALKSYFNNSERQFPNLSGLYDSGFRELLSQPRDIKRVFNAVHVIEPALRGEVVLADILGLVTLMVKAATVFELLHKNPEYFVGRVSNTLTGLSPEQSVNEGAEERKRAYQTSSSPRGAQRLVHYLFPMVAKDEEEPAFGFISNLGQDGRLAHPSRLVVALQQSISPAAVSTNLVRRFLLQPDERDAIVKRLSDENCLDFLEQLGKFAASIEGQNDFDAKEFSLTFARLADQDPLASLQRNSKDFIFSNSVSKALYAIDLVTQNLDTNSKEEIAEMLVKSDRALSVAAEVLIRSYAPRNGEQSVIYAPQESKDELSVIFSANVLHACEDNKIFGFADPQSIFLALSIIAPEECKKVYAALKATDPTLDEFALAIMTRSFDTVKGRTYKLSVELIDPYCPLNEFKTHAINRLADETLTYPARAAWRSVAEDKNLYAVDGTVVRR